MRLPRCVKVLSEGNILHLVPAITDTQPCASMAEHIEGGGLLGDQGSLALWEDQDAGIEFNLYGSALPGSRTGQKVRKMNAYRCMDPSIRLGDQG